MTDRSRPHAGSFISSPPLQQQHHTYIRFWLVVYDWCRLSFSFSNCCCCVFGFRSLILGCWRVLNVVELHDCIWICSFEVGRLLYFSRLLWNWQCWHLHCNLSYSCDSVERILQEKLCCELYCQLPTNMMCQLHCSKYAESQQLITCRC